jgi:hypothetical protein
MTKEQFKHIDRQSYTKRGVLVVTVPIKAKGVAVLDREDKYIFVSSKLPRAARSKLINKGLEKHKDGFGQATVGAEVINDN